jgi:hypothetical protein
MFRTIGDQVSLWESLLPEEVLRLPEELARVDVLPDDLVFFAPFAPHFDPLVRPALHSYGVLPAADVLEVPLPAGVREPVRRGQRLDHVAAVLPDPAG